MASIQERRNKDGKLISFSIRVHRGRDANGKQLKPWTTTFKIEPTWSEKSARKKAMAYASVFEKECREGLRSDNRQKFQDYSEYVIDLKVNNGMKHSTEKFYRDLSKRVYPVLGHLKVRDIHTDTLNAFYLDLGKEGANKRTGEPLSAKSILGYHRFISTILAQACKEGLIPFNPAVNATTPKVNKPEPKYYQPEEVYAIRDALESEPIRLKVLVHLLLITGARRGEILGLKWQQVDFENNRIHICNTVEYSPQYGVYEDTPKTKESIRYISLPVETMELLREYRMWQMKERFRLGSYYQNQDFVLCQENGNPIHPDSVGKMLNKFANRHNNLPHLNAHAFRHTMASMLYFSGADSVSISKRLGHERTSTTSDIYSHLIAKADEKNAEIIADVFLKKA